MSQNVQNDQFCTYPKNLSALLWWIGLLEGGRQGFVEVTREKGTPGPYRAPPRFPTGARCEDDAATDGSRVEIAEQGPSGLALFPREVRNHGTTQEVYVQGPARVAQNAW